MRELLRVRWVMFPVALLMFGSLLRGDVIYLKNGSVLLVEKAWEEGEQVKYQSASGVESIPRASVKRFQGHKATPADPSHNQTVHAEVIRGTETPAVSSPQVPKVALKPAASDTRAAARSARYRDAAGFAEAVREQEKTGKPVALYFYVDWCKYCARLERETLIHPEVKKYLESILYVSVNPEHGQEEEALFGKFEGRGFPTFLMLTKSKVATEVSTAVPAESFLQECKEAAGSASR